jgi:hypothetical protein
MKAFSVFLTELNEGATHSAISADLAELLRTVRAVEDAFGEYVATVREQSGYQVLIGKAG